MVYFAALRHIDEPRCIARYFAFMYILQNLHEPSISSFSCYNMQFIFAQTCKRWLFLSSAIRACSLYFAATYRLAMFRPTCKKSKMKHTPASHSKRAQKSKIKNTQTQKIDVSHNDHIFYHAATAPYIMLLAAFFLRECAQAKRVASQQYNKKLCSLFLKYLCLLWYVLYYALLP